MGKLANQSDGGSSRRSDAPRWYAVHTLPHRETGAARQLEFQGYRVFLPTHWKTIRHARRFRTVKAPFFPRYLFVRLDLERERWRPVNGTFGVSSLVMAGDRPMPIPFGVVEALGALTDDSGTLSFTSIMQAGQNVRILNGPFADRVGELVHAGDKERVQILLDVMGVRMTVHASTRALAPVA